MSLRITVSPLGWARRAGELLTAPLVYLVSGTFRESPQRTRSWNVNRIIGNGTLDLRRDLMIRSAANPDALKGDHPILSHMPIFGGWRDYIVIEPVSGRDWYVGWIVAGSKAELSRIRLSGPIRVLVGPSVTFHFGFDAETGKQVPLNKIGSGRIGDHGKFSTIDLL
ncbi:MAG: hypothetical protein HGA31_02025 [Candidatus Moranbacteria bacterium]|nr:hypothetical protein [Candidatus Moranbacteria bacterium]